MASGDPTRTSTGTALACALCVVAAVLTLFALQGCDDGGANSGDTGSNNGSGTTDPAICRDAPEPPWSQQVEDDALKTMRDFLRTEGLRSPHAWATGHAMLALGPDVRVHDDAGNSQDALTFIFQFMQQEAREGQVLYTLPVGVQGYQVSPHTDMFIKIFDDIGVSLDDKRPSPVGEVTVRDLYRSARSAFANDSKALVDDLAWSLQAFTRQPASPTFATAGHGDASIAQMIDWALLYQKVEWKAVREAREARSPIARDGMPSSTCAGWHNFQGLVVALARGFGTPAQRTEFDSWLPDFDYRIRCEPNILRDAFPTGRKKEGQWAGESQAVIDMQFARGAQERLKFYGHALEALAYAADGGLIPTTAPWTDLATTCRSCVAEAVQDLVTMQFYGAQSRVSEWVDHAEPEYRQMYLDAIGDAAHAVHALQMWRGIEE